MKIMSNGIGRNCIIMQEKVNAVVGQSGGPTAAINASLAGVIRAAGKVNDNN